MGMVRVFAFRSPSAREDGDFSQSIELGKTENCREFLSIISKTSEEYRYLDYFDVKLKKIGDYYDAWKFLGGLHLSILIMDGG